MTYDPKKDGELSYLAAMEAIGKTTHCLRQPSGRCPICQKGECRRDQ